MPRREAGSRKAEGDIGAALVQLMVRRGLGKGCGKIAQVRIGLVQIAKRQGCELGENGVDAGHDCPIKLCKILCGRLPANLASGCLGRSPPMGGAAFEVSKIVR